MTREEVRHRLQAAWESLNLGGSVGACLELYDILTAEKLEPVDGHVPSGLSIESDRDYWKNRAEMFQEERDVATRRALAAEEANKIHGDGLTAQYEACRQRAIRAEAERDGQASSASAWRNQAEQRGKELGVQRERACTAEDDRDCWRRKAESLEDFIVKGDGVAKSPSATVAAFQEGYNTGINVAVAAAEKAAGPVISERDAAREDLMKVTKERDDLRARTTAQHDIYLALLKDNEKLRMRIFVKQTEQIIRANVMQAGGAQVTSADPKSADRPRGEAAPAPASATEPQAPPAASSDEVFGWGAWDREAGCLRMSAPTKEAAEEWIRRTNYPDVYALAAVMSAPKKSPATAPALQAEYTVEDVAKIIIAAAAEEREACAKIADSDSNHEVCECPSRIAKRIRARK